MRRGEVSAESAIEYLAELADLPLERYEHRQLPRRAFELRDNVTMYDAMYLALAAAPEVRLLTADAALAAVPGSLANVIVMTSPR